MQMQWGNSWNKMQAIWDSSEWMEFGCWAADDGKIRSFLSLRKRILNNSKTFRST